MKRYIVVESGPCGTFCEGIYVDYYTALGFAVDRIYELKRSYMDDGDEFRISDPEDDEGQAGVVINVYYKASCWDHGNTEHYYILFYESID